MVTEVFAIRKCDIDQIIQSSTSSGYNCQSQNIEYEMPFELYESIDNLGYFYFHVKFKKGKVLSIHVGTTKDWQYNLITTKDLLHYHETGEIIPLEIVNYTREENEMFQNYVIESVEFGELNVVAIKASIKEIAKEMEGVSLEKEGGDTYLVKDGNAVKLDSEEFQAQVQKYVVGKTLGELRKNAAMYKLITKLGLISKVVLAKSESGLAGIFGD